MAILFWFYRDVEVVASRLSAIRHLNPNVPVYGLYGGPRADVDLLEDVTSRLDDLWLHPEVSQEWAWRNGDLMIASWFRERGRSLRWSSLFVHQWDLLLGCPVADFDVGDERELVLPGVRPLEEVAGRWVWVQPWSRIYPDFVEFSSRPLVRGHPLLACVFVFATLGRRFLEEYSEVAPQMPGYIEYRLPTLASRMGYRFRSCPDAPDWGDRGDPLLNGCQRAVTSGQVLASRRARAARAWHPVYEQVAVTDLTADAGREAGAAAGGVVLLHVLPARPGVVAGGSQAVADTLARGLAAAGHQVTVLSGTTDDRATSWVHGGVQHRSAFPITTRLLQGEPDVRYFAGEMAALEGCSAAFMFERVFPMPPGVDRILVLGATAYRYAPLAVLSPHWDRMIVPSSHVHDYVRSVLAEGGQEGRLERVTVVPNPVDPEALGLAGSPPAKERPPHRVHMLFPHRADAGKGIDASLRLLMRLRRTHDASLIVVVDDSAAADGFSAGVLGAARSLGVLDAIVFRPWLPRAQMHALYASADLTLCLGDRPEGFGLVCLESVLCGTPVLARDAGAQTHLLPPGHGCFVADEDEERLTGRVREILGDEGLPGQLALGGDYVRRAFSTAAFVGRVRALARLA